MEEQRRLREVWCKGLDLSSGNRLATQRVQPPLPCSLSLSPPRSLCSLPCQDRGGTGGGLKCKRGRGSETGGKWEEQRAEWERDVAEMVPAPAFQHGGVFVHVCGCVCLCAFLVMSRPQETACRLLLQRTYPIESLRGPPAGIETLPSISQEWWESRMSEKQNDIHQ